MTKKIIILLLIALVTFAQPHQRTARREEGKVFSSLMLQLSGGFHKSSDEETNQLKKAAPFLEVEKAARDFYSLHAGVTLGEVVGIEKQIVSGINFKITFSAAPEVNDQTVEIIVYTQPWTKTVQVTSVVPPIDGVTDSTGRILPDIIKN